MTAYAVVAVIKLTNVTRAKAEQLTKRIYAGLWDSMPEYSAPDAVVVLFDGTPIHKIFSTVSVTADKRARIKEAQHLMDQLDARNYRTERMRVRNWIAALRAGRMTEDNFERKVATMRAWLSVRGRK